MSTYDSTSAGRAAIEQELRDFIAGELLADGTQSISVEDDLIQSGIVDSLGVTQVVAFCESRYGFRVTDADLVPANFKSVRRIAEYVERKRT